jgi:hypothetical protein
VQFSVKHESYTYGHCAGGYLKLLPEAAAGEPKAFGGDSKYNLMFGPDLCSYDVSKIHLILNKGGDNLEKKDEIKLDYDEKNEFTHLYTLHLKPDNSAEVFFDQKSKWAGKLSDGWCVPFTSLSLPAWLAGSQRVHLTSLYAYILSLHDSAFLCCAVLWASARLLSIKEPTWRDDPRSERPAANSRP